VRAESGLKGQINTCEGRYKGMKKAVTIYIDDDAGIEEVCATFVLHNSSGDTSVHMINLNWKDKNKVYLPWKGDAVMGKEEE
jgi:hypothetical protein